ncbi:hypothetical protein EON76_01935 [bacterium]|nr:MAG: hypothetical protein EON76_01935 [bacterium]
MTEVDYTVQKTHAIADVSKNYFGVEINVKKIIASDIITGNNVFATLFIDTSGDIYVLLESDDKSMTLGDVMTMIKSMNLEAAGYLAPHRDRSYFTKRGYEAYSAVFPGRDAAEADTTYYQTLSVYSPALVKIRRMTGDLYSYNTVSQQWRKEYDKLYIQQEVSNE